MFARRILISGIVQGVGFRPFIYALATQLGLRGQVYNTSAGVVIDVEGDAATLLAFEQRIPDERPALAQIDTISSIPSIEVGYAQFRIVDSVQIANAFQPISPDVATCPECLEELFDPSNRRYRYPFINCTNCGPRFTIIQDIPYDRPNTTMAGFPLCPACAAEYHEPTNRRFHAQPVACPICGPHIWLEASKNFPNPIYDEIISIESPAHGHAYSSRVISEVQRLLNAGSIVAIKGLGGFHLACDATNSAAVEALRRRKLRVDKPFALMVPDTESAAEICHLNEEDLALLRSRQRPIVIMTRRFPSSIVEQIAPGQQTLGLMLPYTPLHALLFERVGEAPPPKYLVMTSGNLSEEPIATDNDQAREQLSALCDAFLMHDRPIHMRCDDSVVRASPDGQPYILRRARGYAPRPIRLTGTNRPSLAVGAALKNTFALSRDEYTILSHHIGDLENYETLRDFEQGIAHFERLFRIIPERLAYDLHPDYLSTRYALARADAEGLPALGIQHHHAHIASVMAEHAVAANEAVIGLSFDGTGFGPDGAIWGGEVLLVRYTGFQRLAHLKYIPLPGGDSAIRRPARTALAHLWSAGIAWDPDLPCTSDFCSDDLLALRGQLTHSLNAPATSSMGRLFDAAAAIAGVRQKVNYEAQAAIEFEAIADPGEKNRYPFDLPDLMGSIPTILDPTPMIHALVDDVQRGISLPIISAQFHNTLAEIAAGCAVSAARQTKATKVALSGGVWQNDTLLRKTLSHLHGSGLEILMHRQVPANDGGIALGQIAILAHTG